MVDVLARQTALAPGRASGSHTTTRCGGLPLVSTVLRHASALGSGGWMLAQRLTLQAHRGTGARPRGYCYFVPVGGWRGHRYDGRFSWVAEFVWSWPASPFSCALEAPRLV